MNPLHKRMAEALTSARKAAESVTGADGGTCNHDTLLIRSTNIRPVTLVRLANAAGITAYATDRWGTKYVALQLGRGMAHMNTAPLEAARKSLQESVSDFAIVMMWYAID